MVRAHNHLHAYPKAACCALLLKTCYKTYKKNLHISKKSSTFATSKDKKFISY